MSQIKIKSLSFPTESQRFVYAGPPIRLQKSDNKNIVDITIQKKIMINKLSHLQ